MALFPFPEAVPNTESFCVLVELLPAAVAEETVVVVIRQRRNIDSEGIFFEDLFPLNDQPIDFRNEFFTFFCRSVPIFDRKFTIQLKELQAGRNKFDAVAFRKTHGNFGTGGLTGETQNAVRGNGKYY